MLAAMTMLGACSLAETETIERQDNAATAPSELDCGRLRCNAAVNLSWITITFDSNGGLETVRFDGGHFT